MRKPFIRIFSWLVLCLLCFGLGTGHAEEGKQERLGTLDEAYILLDLQNAPEDAPKSMPSYKFVPQSFDKAKAEQLLQDLALPQFGGAVQLSEQGDLEKGSLAYYAKPSDYDSFNLLPWVPRLPLDESKKGAKQASDSAKAFLDGLGLAYEYPFYQVTESLHLQEDTQKHIYFIVARLSVEDRAFPSIVGWTETSKASSDGKGDPAPCAFFYCTEDGKIQMAYVRDALQVEEKTESEVSLLPWKELLEQDSEFILKVYCQGEQPASYLALEEVELMNMVDTQYNSYPAWIYTLRAQMPSIEGHPDGYSWYIQLSYNALTGERTW